MTIFDLLFVLTLLLTLILLLTIAANLLRGRTDKARRIGIVLGGWLGIYAVLLLGAGIFSQPKQLVLGEPKCFDEWCFSLDKAVRKDNFVALVVTVSNEGRGRPQRPDSPRLSVIADDRQIPILDARVSEQVVPGQPNSFEIHAPPDCASAKDLQLLVTEGGWPSKFVIDEENSPFHAKAAWRIAP